MAAGVAEYLYDQHPLEVRPEINNTVLLRASNRKINSGFETVANSANEHTHDSQLHKQKHYLKACVAQ